jgi:nicotinamide-nucleotide amidase
MGADMEILSVGNELLIGKIPNTNAQWLCKQATSLGVAVKRVTVLPDNIDETAQAIKETLKRKPRFILTTGGLGPTFDDKTLETIAKTLNRKLEVNQKALRMVKEKYQMYAAKTGISHVDLTDARVKMATIPEGTVPINNPVGTAPAVRADLESTILFALPGVPREMEAIFEETVAPMLKEASDGVAFYEDSLFVDNIMESLLAPLIDVTMRDNPGIYVKSHPKGEENLPHIEIHLSAMGANAEEAKEKLDKAAAQLSSLIARNKGKVYPKEHRSVQSN